ncbi:putative nucleotidyltransferase [Paenibacillus shirakamiensis]|uniref:Nucleotidyltransferase n=1 Tax=Paenibacillus shirakamiensis TaxID=1265935 RepID=A0ABS4JIL6_9BACL|nr:nucleotidyltransferase domain-containing protein [Paenibacillus shirakamiensis]MBP2000816.1 putative nucleotidyltransferase [Paenibacillus shirakamiensis]
MPNYRKQILEELRRIEIEEHVRILYACESGSRAWGFPSQDSDYDVRFIYIRPVEWYLSLYEKRDVIERPINNLLDINGWDLQKALKLFAKSNPPLLEWLQSPILYQENYSITEQIRAFSADTFSPRACCYHYLHMAKGNFRQYLQGEQVKLKKYFYVLRPLLACQWIEKYNTMPPMEFQQLVDMLVPKGSDLDKQIQDLLRRKMAGDELDMELRIQSIHNFIEAQIQHYEQSAASFPSAEMTDQQEQLNDLFLAALGEVWN